VIEPVEYCMNLSEFEERHRDHQLAEATWKRICEAHHEERYSPDYGRGFVDGFEDYLYAGGNGEPPALPPRDYWKPKYESPEGRKAVQDWFAGFRHGVLEARLGGYRQLVLVPASSPPMSAATRFNPTISGPPRDFTVPGAPFANEINPGSISPPVNPTEVLPQPSKAQPPSATLREKSPDGGVTISQPTPIVDGK